MSDNNSKQIKGFNLHFKNLQNSFGKLEPCRRFIQSSIDPFFVAERS